jgi:flagellar operon protein
MTDPFHVQLGRVNGAGQEPEKPASTPKPVQGPSFTQVLDNVQNVRFSNHAQKRLESRDIQLNNESVTRLSDAIDKAEKRGGKSSLVMVDDVAFIVNVPDRTVVTALDKDQRGEGVFTQIDSVVFANPANGSTKSLIDVKG